MSLGTLFCFCNLWKEDKKEVVKEERVVSVECGHTFHRDCLDRWINLNKEIAHGDIRCPRCPAKLSTKLLLDGGFSDEEKAEFKRKIGAAETKILLGITYNELEGKIAALNPYWMDLSACFRNELIDCLFTKSSNLQRILEFRDKNNWELVRSVIDEYIEAITQKNGGKLCWEHVGESFREKLLQKLRNSSGLPRLELHQVPLTPTTFKLLIRDKDDEKKLLGIMISSFIAQMGADSFDVIKSACNLLLHQWIIEALHKSGVKNPTKVDLLYKLGILEEMVTDRNENGSVVEIAPFKFVHASVKHFIHGMIGSRAMDLFKFNKTNNVLIKRHDRFSKYFLNYFLETTARTQGYISNMFDDLRTKIIDTDLLMACVITKLKDEKVLEVAIIHYRQKIKQNLLEKRFSYWIRNRIYDDISFLHLAAISGNLSSVKILTSFLETTKTFVWNSLIFLLLQHSGGCGDNEIEVKKDVIKELLKFNPNLFNKRYNEQNRLVARESIEPQVYLSPITPLFVNEIHVELIKFGLENGANVFTQECANLQTLVHKAASYMNPDQFHDLVDFIVGNGHSRVLPLKNGERETALEIANSRMEVKPETVILFSDAEIE